MPAPDLIGNLSGGRAPHERTAAGAPASLFITPSSGNVTVSSGRPRSSHSRHSTRARRASRSASCCCRCFSV